MNNKIYAVMYSYYSDWEIYGYFTNREDADKYCVAHADQELYVKEIDCYDDKAEEVANVKLKYEYDFTFIKLDNENEYNLQEYLESPNNYTCYQAEFLKSNWFQGEYINHWIRIYVNVGERNYEKAKKIALDLFYQYMKFCNKKPTQKSIVEFNSILAKDETERKEAEERLKIREKELAELARLKEKYENG